MAKIAILSFYSGVVERGVETFAYEIIKRISKKHETTIFQSGSSKYVSGENSPKIEKFVVKEIRVSSSKPQSSGNLLSKLYLDGQSLKILIFTLLTLPKIYKAKSNLIIPLNGGWQTALIRVFSKVTGKKMLISGHAGIGSDDAWNLFFRPDVFVALTRSERDWTKKFVPEVRVATIPNGVDLSRFNPKVQAKNLPLSKPIIVCASALVPYKRLDLTVRAVAKTDKLSLLVLGDGPMHGQIDTLGKRLLGKRYLRIVVPYEQMPAYYRAGQVFTLASKTEAFGISYVEAMACNLPVVTTSDRSREEIINQAGILTNPENIDQYAKDLSIAVNTNYRNIPYNQALKFSWNKIAQDYETLMKDVLKR